MSLPTANLVANFRAVTGLTQSGGRLSVWADQSGLGNDAVMATGSNQPYVTTDFLGRPLIRGSSTIATAYMTLPAGLTLLARNCSIFVAGSKMFPGPSASQGYVSLLGYGGSVAHLRSTNSASLKWQANCANRASGLSTSLNPQAIGIVSGAAACAVYKNTGNVTGLAAVTNDATPRNVALFCGSTAGTAYGMLDAYEIAIYNADVGATQAADVIAYLSATYNLRTTAYTKQIVFEGDSITAGTGLTGASGGLCYPSLMLNSYLGSNWQMMDLAQSGSTVAIMTTRQAACDDCKMGSGRNVLQILIGRNDLATLTAAQTYSALITYIQARVAAGWEVWACTCIASAGLQSSIDTFNGLMRGAGGGGSGNGIIVDAGATRLIDFAADSRFDQGSDSTNSNGFTDYQGDNTHPTVAGATRMAAINSPFIQPLLSVTGTADNGTYAFGAVTTNTPASHQFTIVNATGYDGDVFGTLSISGTGWSISGADDPSGTSLAAGASATVTVIANFATAGSKTGTLTIPSNDPNTPYVINLTATASDPAGGTTRHEPTRNATSMELGL